MSATNHGWYDANAGRSYPIDERATLLDDTGLQLPQHILVDAHLRYPQSLATYAFFGAVSSTATLVTVTILGSDDPESAAVYTPLAALTIRKPVQPYRLYAVEPLAEGVGGWVVFGPGVRDADLYGGRFSTPAQSRLAGKCAHSYRDLPIASVGKRGSRAALTGLVRLSGGSDIDIFGACREVPLKWPLDDSQYCVLPEDVDYEQFLHPAVRRVIVIRLSSTERGNSNVLAKYIGPCDRRPESGNCQDPQPVEQVGGVGPDCDGAVTIEFRGCASITEITEEATLDESGEVVTSVDAVGVIVDCALGLADTCQKPGIPTPDGRLDTEAEEVCIVSSAVLDEALDIDPCEATKLIAPRFDAVDQQAVRDADTRFGVGDSFETTTVGQVTAPSGFRFDGGSFQIIDGGTLGGVDRKWLRTTASGDAQAFWLKASEQPGSWYYKKVAVGIKRALNARLVLGRKDGALANSAYHFVEFDRVGDVWGEIGIRIGLRSFGEDRTIHSLAIPTLPPTTISSEVAELLGYRIEAVVYPDPDDSLRSWIEGRVLISGRSGYPPLAGKIAAAVCDFNRLGYAGFGTSAVDTVFTAFAANNT